MTSATYLPSLEQCRSLLAPATECVVGDPRTQYWVRHGLLYYLDSAVQGADSATFRFFLSGYGSDSRGVFRDGEKDKTLGASTFRCFSFAYHGDQDSVRTWFGGAIRDADASSFEALDAGYEALPGGDLPFLLYPTGYARDRNRVYWCDRGGKGMHVARADPASFLALAAQFGRDDRHVFSGRASLPKARPDNWRRIAGNYSTDGERVYYFNRIIDGADPETFVVFSTTYDMLKFARDKTSFFEGDLRISQDEFEQGLAR